MYEYCVGVCIYASRQKEEEGFMQLVSVYVCVCVCMHMYMYVYVCICICMCMYTCVCVHVYMYVYVCMCICRCICMNIVWVYAFMPRGNKKTKGVR